jgi:cytoskeletal protein CcmA (bactofilin family)
MGFACSVPHLVGVSIVMDVRAGNITCKGSIASNSLTTNGTTINGNTLTNGNTTTNNIEVKNNHYMKADGTQSIYFLSGGGTTFSGTNNNVGRLFGTSLYMYFDFNEAMVFRSFTNKDNLTNNSTRLTINTTGIITQNIFADSITVTGINLKTYTDTISGNLFNNYNTKTQSDNIYYNKSYIDSKLNTLTGSVTTGTITVNNIYFAYSTLPTLTSTSIGYTINYTNAITSVAANEFVNSAVISIPVGIYG